MYPDLSYCIQTYLIAYMDFIDKYCIDTIVGEVYTCNNPI